MRNVVVSTLSEEMFESMLDKLDEIGGEVIDYRLVFPYHRYEIYAKLNFRQSCKLRHFIKHRDVNILEVGS